MGKGSSHRGAFSGVEEGGGRRFLSLEFRRFNVGFKVEVLVRLILTLIEKKCLVFYDRSPPRKNSLRICGIYMMS